MNEAWRKIRRNPLGIAGMVVIGITFLIAVTAYALIPDHTPNANRMHLSLNNKEPGFSVEFLRLPQPGASDDTGFIQFLMKGKSPEHEEIPVSSWQLRGDSVYYRKYAEGTRLPEQSLSVAAFGPSGFKESKHIAHQRFWLGTDKYGRDLLSRTLLGARISFFVGFVSVFISLLVGIPMGLIAGYYGGKVDKVIMWVINVVWSIPSLLMVIAITLALGKGFWQVFVAVGLTMWVEVARVIRGQVLSIKEREFVQAAHVIGFSDLRIMFRHILPNAFAPLIVISAANFAAAILIESGLSFLGVGAQPPVPSWGGMIKDHYGYLIVDKAYLALVPGIAIMTLVLAFMMLGNALRDALDVRRV